MSIRSHLVSQHNNKLISNNEQLFNTTHLLPITIGINISLTSRGKNSINSQINLRTTNTNKNSKVLTIKTSLGSGASASIICKDFLHKRYNILKEKKNVWSTSYDRVL